jgi:hypothetical protein
VGARWLPPEMRAGTALEGSRAVPADDGRGAA